MLWVIPALRAEELEADSMNPNAKYMAYYCLIYAIEKGKTSTCILK